MHEVTTMGKYDLALIAHDARKEEIVLLARAYKEVLTGFALVATRSTGRMITQGTGLPVALVQSTQEGGAQQIGGFAAEGRIKAVIFLRDHLSVHCNDADRLALLRVCDTLDIPLATNVATAKALLHYLCEEKTATRKQYTAARLTETLAGVY